MPKPPAGQPNMQQLMKQAQKMQQQLADAQDRLAGSTVEGSSGGGLVRAVLSGTGELQSLVIDSLRNAGSFVTVESDSGPFAAQYILGLELEHFEARYSGDGPPSIEVTLVCSLGRRSDRSVIVSFTAHSSVQADADRMQAVIAAFGQATSQAMTQIAANIVPPAAPAH